MEPLPPGHPPPPTHNLDIKNEGNCVNRKTLLWIFCILIALACAGCSTDNTVGGNQTEAVKPPPQVRVEAMPTATLAPTTEAVIPPTLEPTLEPTAAQVQYDAPPTPDVDAIANELEAEMDAIDQKLRNQDLLLKP